MTIEWKKTPVIRHQPGFEVEVFIEGYRPTKDTWKHKTYRFDTLDQAIAFRDALANCPWNEWEELLGLERVYQGTGWYGFSYEYCEIYEYSADGAKFHWERVRK